jgi:hypothetical protein
LPFLSGCCAFPFFPQPFRCCMRAEIFWCYHLRLRASADNRVLHYDSHLLKYTLLYFAFMQVLTSLVRQAHPIQRNYCAALFGFQQRYCTYATLMSAVLYRAGAGIFGATSSPAFGTSTGGSFFGSSQASPGSSLFGGGGFGAAPATGGALFGAASAPAAGTSTFNFAPQAGTPGKCLGGVLHRGGGVDI